MNYKITSFNLVFWPPCVALYLKLTQRGTLSKLVASGILLFYYYFSEKLRSLFFLEKIRLSANKSYSNHLADESHGMSSDFMCSLFPRATFVDFTKHIFTCAVVHVFLKPASVAQLDTSSDWRPGGRGFNPRRGRQHSFMEIDHEIFSTVILCLPLIQEGQLSRSGERMCTIQVNRLED